MATFYTAQVTLPYLTNLPRDVTVNTFHFQGGASAAELSEAQQIAQRCSDFYGGSGSVGAIAGFLSNEIGALATIKVYDAQAAEPRPIFYQDTFALQTNRDSPGDLPPEVALCLSYYGTANQKRQRGRLYIGPFCLSQESASGSYAQPIPGLVTTLIEAGARLAKNTGAVAQHPTTLLPTTPSTGPTAVIWSVRSKFAALTGATAGNLYTPINFGWCDNEWDSQRRRRIAATSRMTFAPA
jgi:hypothetical protein